MAQFEHDDAPIYSTSEQPKAGIATRVTQAPLFVSRSQPKGPINWADRNRERREQRARLAHYAEEKAARESEGSSSTENALAKSARGGNWLNSRSGTSERKFGLEEAWQMADNNGNSRPKTAQGTGKGDAGRQRPLQEGQIARNKTYTPGQNKGNSPPMTLTDAYRMAERQERDAQVVNSDSESTGPRQGSPSPAARDRRRPSGDGLSRGNENRPPAWMEKYAPEEVAKLMTWEQRTALGAEEFRNRQRSGSESSCDRPEDPELKKNREKIERRAAFLKRAAASTKPLFTSTHGAGRQVGERVSETVKALGRETSDSFLDEPEPPMDNVPRKWTSKARKQHPAWVENILNPENKNPAESEEILQVAANTPLPSVESGFEPTSPSSRSNLPHPGNISPEKSKMWDADLDFTGHSLQISTSPQLKVRSNRLDNLRDREIQTLTKRAVATNRLEEIRERNSEDRSVLSESSRLNLRELPQDPTKTQDIDDTYHERTILEEEGEHIIDTPVTVFSAGSYRESRDKDSNYGEENDRRPSHKREDSFELLRRLSRAASNSPAPKRLENMEEEVTDHGIERVTLKDAAKAEERPTQLKDEQIKSLISKPVEKSTDDKHRKSGLVRAPEAKRSSRSSSRPRSEIDPEERITAEAKLFDLPDSKSERNSLRAPSLSPPSSDEEKFEDETPRPQKLDPLSLPTPRVTGAFIETPAPTVRKSRQPRTISPYYDVDNQSGIRELSPESNQKQHVDHKAESLEEDRRDSRDSRRVSAPQRPAPKPESRPPLINTANPITAAETLRRIKLEAQIEDSTLDEFDVLLDEDKATADVGNTTTILEPLLDLEYDENGRPLSKKERERRLDELQLERMNQNLKHASSTIRDTRQGIERLERRVSSASENPVVAASLEFDGQLYIKIPVPRLWINLPESSTKGRNGGFFKTNWKFTWLGMLLFIFFSWFLAESVMCDVYCHPKYATTSNWHYTDPFFPWAIPTKLDQWTGQVASGTVDAVIDYGYDLFTPGGRKSRYHRYSSPGYGAARVQRLKRDEAAQSDIPDESDAGSFSDDEIIL